MAKYDQPGMSSADRRALERLNQQYQKALEKQVDLIKEENDLINKSIDNRLRAQKRTDEADKRALRLRQQQERASKEELRAREKAVDSIEDATKDEARARRRGRESIDDLFNEEAKTRRKAIQQGLSDLKDRAKDAAGAVGRAAIQSSYADRKGGTNIAGGVADALGSITAALAALPHPVAKAAAVFAKVAQGAARVGAVAETTANIVRGAARDNQRFVKFGRGNTAERDKRSYRSLAEAYKAAGDEINSMTDALAEATAQAAYYGFNQEEAQETLVKIANQTGESFDKAYGNMFKNEGIINTINQLSSMGMGSIQELGDTFIDLMNKHGKSADQALADMRQVASAAQGVSGLEGAVIPVDKFYSALSEVAADSGSYAISMENLSKVMAGGAKTAKKLGFSMEQSLKAAKDLTGALTQNFDEGFATITAQSDLEALMQDETITGERKDQLTNLAEAYKAGMITPDKLAEGLKGMGFTQQESVLQNRMAMMLRDPIIALQGAFGPVSAELQQLLISATREMKATGQSSQQYAKQFFADPKNKAEIDKAYGKGADAMRSYRTSMVEQAQAGKESAQMRIAGEAAASSAFTSVNSAANQASEKLRELTTSLSSFSDTIMTYSVYLSRADQLKAFEGKGTISVLGKGTSQRDVETRTVTLDEMRAANEVAKKTETASALATLHEQVEADNKKRAQDLANIGSRPPTVGKLLSSRVGATGDISLNITIPAATLGQATSVADNNATSAAPTAP